MYLYCLLLIKIVLVPKKTRTVKTMLFFLNGPVGTKLQPRIKHFLDDKLVQCRYFSNLSFLSACNIEYLPTYLLSDCQHECNLRVGNMITSIYIQIADIDKSYKDSVVFNFKKIPYYLTLSPNKLFHKPRKRSPIYY